MEIIHSITDSYGRKIRIEFWDDRYGIIMDVTDPVKEEEENIYLVFVDEEQIKILIEILKEFLIQNQKNHESVIIFPSLGNFLIENIK